MCNKKFTNYVEKVKDDVRKKVKMFPIQGSEPTHASLKMSSLLLTQMLLEEMV